MHFLCICTRFHKTTATIRVAGVIPDLPVATAQLFKFRSKKNMKTNSQQSFLFRFKFSSKQFPLPTQFQVVSIDLQYYMLHSNTSTTAAQTDIRGYLMHLRNQNQRSQTDKQSLLWPFLLTVRCQPTISTPSFHCAFSAMTVPISLSQHSSTYTARQTTMLQASISRSPVSANVRQAPLFLHTTETSGVQLLTSYHKKCGN